MLDFVNKFDLASEVEDAPQKIKDILKDPLHLEFDGNDKTAKNTKIVLIWISEIIYRAHMKHFGQTAENLPGKGNHKIHILLPSF